VTEEQRQRLRNIKTFKQLLAFLRDDLDWPIEPVADEDELTFDWSDDLGLKDSERVGIKEIKQLRPLESGQPWGIFFINFEKKRLPIVILRRILNALVLKKRVSANNAQRASWQQHDLLFISAYGEESDRQLTFAHFNESAGEVADKPTLRVLGWDDEDTNLRLDYVADKLHANLTWPSDASNVPAWRMRWSEAFEFRPRQVIDTAEELALRLAELAKRIRNRALRVLPHETEKGELRKLMNGFKVALIHDLDDAAFADMYAQTITYGLFSAAVSRTVPGAGTAVVQDNVVDMVPVTNPFLKEMLQSFLKAGGRKGKLDFDELGIQEVVDLLNDPNTRLDAVLRDFGNRTRGEDPVIHFYEHFLSAYNKKLKVQRGVFYTPQPVVSYIVRSVHQLLQTEFGLVDGLADSTTWGEMLVKHPDMKLPPLTDEPGETRTISPDEPFVQILDPATGTATFLVEVIDVIHRTMMAKWTLQKLNEAQRLAAWNDYVPKHLLPRLYAYELMMAPYAIAHMKVGLKLAETGYRFGSDERARIYLTNALEPWLRQLPMIGFEALAHEAAAVNEVKRNKRFTVVVGNPPYSSQSQNMGEWARGIIDFYFNDDSGRIEERGNRNQLQDDYVKCFRVAQLAIDTSGTGIVGYISNSSYMKGPWFRGMRYQLMKDFESISILDLHGSHAHALDSQQIDQNVFEITTPVAIAILRKRLPGVTSGGISYSEIRGSRSLKYEMLSGRTANYGAAIVLAPSRGSQWRFLPHDDTNQAEWVTWTSIPNMFVDWGAGVLTNRNGLAVADTRHELMRKARRFADLSVPDETIEAECGFSSNYQWATGKARREFAKVRVADLAAPYTFRPFDFQFIYWHKNLVYNRRGNKMEVFREDAPPLALMFSRNTKHSTYTNIYVTRQIADRDCLEKANVAPLYTSSSSEGLFAGHLSERRCNLSAAFVTQVTEQLAQSLGAPLSGDIFHYAYAVFHSPDYRSRYAEFLKIDFPRLPVTANLGLFHALATLGSELVSLHLLESPILDQPITTTIGKAREVAKVGWTQDNGGTVWIDAGGKKDAYTAGTMGFCGVPEAVWRFHIGGYQVCEKWLKDRKGRSLSNDDIAHYQKIVVALSETIRLMAEIDYVIDQHGGWPGAFQTEAPA